MKHTCNNMQHYGVINMEENIDYELRAKIY